MKGSGVFAAVGLGLMIRAASSASAAEAVQPAGDAGDVEAHVLGHLRRHAEVPRDVPLDEAPVRQKIEADPLGGDAITSFVFEVRNVPAALYKAMGGFATNGVNMIKLESYMVGGSFTATQFYADIEGHPEHTSVRLAMEELDFFTKRVKILGVYPASPFRRTQAAG